MRHNDPALCKAVAVTPSACPFASFPTQQDRRIRPPRLRARRVLSVAVQSVAVLCVAVLCVTVLASVARPSRAGAQTTGAPSPPSSGAVSSPGASPVTAAPPPTVTATDSTRPAVGAPIPNIIPEPNSGRAPRDPGDRGGWWQEALFFLMCAAVLLIAGLVWAESRRARRRQGRLPGPSTTHSRPSGR